MKALPKPHPAIVTERRSLVEDAYATLKAWILDGTLPPGHRALEEAYTLMLGMSRTPVREALIRLAQEGLVAFLPRRGIRVSPLTRRDMREINEVLACLECEAAERLAARHPPPEDIAHLAAAVADMDAALEARDMDRWSEADFRFHCLLIDLCGNRHLAAVARGFLEKAHRFRVLTNPVRDPPLYSNVNHAAVLEAVRRGDARTAGEIHRAHKRRWARELADLTVRLDIAEGDDP